MAITLIPSAAYSTPELICEFGKLPPAFLPAGSQRLYKLQHDLLSGVSSQIFLSLPEDFEIPIIDADLINKLKLEIIYVPQGLSIGESVVYAMNMISSFHEPLRILLGDNIIYDLDFEDTDCFTAHDNIESYSNWAFCKQKSDNNYWLVEGYLTQPDPEDLILSGYFCFRQPYVLIRSITKARGNLIRGLNFYNREIGLHPCSKGLFLDFGDANTYYRSRKYLATQRSFNDVQISRNTFIKSSKNNSKKIVAEQEWYQNIPSSLSIYLPKLIDSGTNAQGVPFYELEYLYLPTLADIFVYGKQAIYIWQEIFSSICNFLNLCSHFQQPSDEDIQFEKLYLPKTLERLEKFSSTRNISLQKNLKINGCVTPSLLEIVELVSAQISPVNQKKIVLFMGICASAIYFTISDLS